MKLKIKDIIASTTATIPPTLWNLNIFIAEINNSNAIIKSTKPENTLYVIDTKKGQHNAMIPSIINVIEFIFIFIR